MSNFTQTFRGTAVSETPTTPAIYNISVPLADTEVSQALSAGTKQFRISARGNSRIKLAFTAGQSGTNYVTISRGASRKFADINFTGTLYFQTSEGSETVEIEEWT